MDSRVALLIDSENVSYKYIEDIIKEAANYGSLVVSRFYGDITKLANEWKNKAQEYAIKPMHQFNVATRKNAADMEMALDAISLCYDNKADIFFIVTSDSDFTPLAMKLKELGKIVIGVGDLQKVTNAFKSACSEFKYFQYFDKTETIEKEDDADSLKQNITNIIIESGDNNRIQLSRIGDILTNRQSDFDPRKYGSSSLSALVSKLGFHTESENTTTFVTYQSSLTLEDIKKSIEEMFLKDKTLNISQTKISIEEKYPGFNYKHFGFSKFGLLLNHLNYKVSKHTFKK